MTVEVYLGVAACLVLPGLAAWALRRSLWPAAGRGLPVVLAVAAVGLTLGATAAGAVMGLRLAIFAGVCAIAAVGALMGLALATLQARGR